MDGAQTCSWHTERRAHSASPSNSSTSDAFEAATGAASLQEVQLRSAVVQLITGLGDPDQLREGLRDTPKVHPYLVASHWQPSHKLSETLSQNADTPILQRVAKAWRQVVPAPGETVDRYAQLPCPVQSGTSLAQAQAKSASSRCCAACWEALSSMKTL